MTKKAAMYLAEKKEESTKEAARLRRATQDENKQEEKE